MIINNCVSRLWFKAEDPHSGISLLRFNIINLSNNSIAENGSIPVNTSTVVSNKQIQIYSPKIIEFSFVCVYFIISFKLLFLPPILTLRTWRANCIISWTEKHVHVMISNPFNFSWLLNVFKNFLFRKKGLATKDIRFLTRITFINMS